MEKCSEVYTTLAATSMESAMFKSIKELYTWGLPLMITLASSNYDSPKNRFKYERITGVNYEMFIKTKKVTYCRKIIMLCSFLVLHSVDLHSVPLVTLVSRCFFVKKYKPRYTV